jgi:PAS domain S-box-containing protein
MVVMKFRTLSNLKLSHQAILLTAVPLLFELVFITALVVNLKQLEKGYAMEAYAREVSMTINSSLQIMLEGAGAYAVYETYGLPEYLTKFQNAVSQLKGVSAKLTDLVQREQSDELFAFKNASMQVMRSLEEAHNIDIQRGHVGRLKNAMRVQHMLIEANRHGNRIIREQVVTNEKQRLDEARLRRQLEIIIFLGVALNIALAAFLVWNFNRTTSQRLDILMQNMMQLAMERPLQQRIAGSDELASIDKVFHTMAGVLAEARRKEKALTENALSVICSLDSTGRFTSINKAVEEIWGYSEEELTGRSLVSILADDDKARIAAAFSNMTNKNSALEFEARLKRKDLGLIDIVWSAQWSQFENSWFCVAHDISDRKRIEKLKQEVIAMVGHDLRAPLTSLKATLSMFELGTMGELTEAGKKRILAADAVIDRMVLIINDLLDIDKFQSGAIPLKCSHVPIQELIARAFESVRGNAEAKQIRINIEQTDLTLWCDAPRIVRVLINLLDNAIKFSPQQSKIEISLQESDEYTTLSVLDYGRGISADKVGMVFERFKQLDRSDEFEKGGSGLGLAICKAIVEAHQGSIGVESTEGAGSRFWFKLPNRSAT